MTITKLEIQGYRSLKDVSLDLEQLNVLVGANGSGKTNLYKALHLLNAATTNDFAQEIARDGGIASVLWAGRRHKNEADEAYIAVYFDELDYNIAFGRIPLSDAPTEDMTCFRNDPDIKKEKVSLAFRGKRTVLVERAGGLVTARNMDGRRIQYPLAVSGRESILSGLRDPQKFPELSSLREEFLTWRFYHQFRTDLDSPIRQPQIGVLTPVLSHSGIDLGASLATIRAIGDVKRMNDSIAEAFNGGSLNVENEEGEFTISMNMPRLTREFDISELSDGTVQYLCLLAVLLTPRPPTFLVLNEPETSIFPNLLEPLAKLIVEASRHSQILITTHSQTLASFIKKLGKVVPIELSKENGETKIKRKQGHKSN